MAVTSRYDRTVISTVKYVMIYEYVAGLVGDTLKPGDKIPSERELCERFDVSRMTVRQAIQALVNEGVLERQQGRGTFVAEEKMDLQLRLTSFAQEMRMRGMVPSTEVLSAAEEIPPRSIASSLGIGEGEYGYHLIRLRYANDIPMALEDLWIPVALLPGFFTPAPPEGIYVELAQRGFLPTWGEDNIESVNLDGDTAARLDVPKGSAGLKIMRRTFSNETPVAWSVSYYRGDRYKLWVPIMQPMSTLRPPVVGAVVRAHRGEE